MAIFKVFWNKRIYAPHTWSRDKARLFGDANQGAEVEAASAQEAIEAFARANRLNPGLLTTDKDQARGV